MEFYSSNTHQPLINISLPIFSYREKKQRFKSLDASEVQAKHRYFSFHFNFSRNRRIGFYGVFALAGTFYTVALLYGLFILKEVPQKNEKKNSQLVKKSFCADFFDFDHIRETFLVAFKARVKNRRTKILALMAVIIIVVGPQHGMFECATTNLSVDINETDF